MHLHLILGELRANKFTPENIVGYTSEEFARSIQTVTLAWFATLVDHGRDGLKVFDLWRQLFPKHKERIEGVWREIEIAWNLVWMHRDKIAFHADKPLAYFKARIEMHENLGTVIKALDSFLALSVFLLTIEDEELPDFGQVVQEMLKEIGDQLGYRINSNQFRKLMTMPSEEDIASLDQ
ncbi:MAG TPA: hypothetical protein VEW69_05155 [Alphaproteobacteria bacterium]|nr:hypothetical protein [Alphaproteobacteria bacterium]